jgi:hypothetical protein
VALIEPPLYWLLHSLGLVGRSLWITCATGGLTLVACLAGIPHGATGIALAYSVVMSLWLVPCLAWCVHGTPVRLGDLYRTIWCPLLGSAVATAAAYVMVRGIAEPLERLLLGGVLMLGVYAVLVWFVFRQRDLYLGLAKDLRLMSKVSG